MILQSAAQPLEVQLDKNELNITCEMIFHNTMFQEAQPASQVFMEHLPRCCTPSSTLPAFSILLVPMCHMQGRFSAIFDIIPGTSSRGIVLDGTGGDRLASAIRQLSETSSLTSLKFLGSAHLSNALTLFGARRTTEENAHEHHQINLSLYVGYHVFLVEQFYGCVRHTQLTRSGLVVLPLSTTS